MAALKRVLLPLLCCLFFCTGCFGSLDGAYEITGRAGAFAQAADEPDGFTQGFAQDLCIVENETAFDESLISAQAGALFSLGEVETLYSKAAFERLYPASITKVMTALVAIRYGNLDDVVTVTEDSRITESGATLCGIKPGDRLTLLQLLYGLMLPSGNDAGAAIAVHMAGSIEAFADMMNEEAKRLGATGTHFVNPHGLQDSNHYTTVYDLYLIFHEALKYPIFRQVTGTTAFTANYTDGDGNAVSRTWTGGNWYLTGERDEPDGVYVFSGKTGTTQAAGYCLIAAERDDNENEYISVVLKADSRAHLYDNMTNIISKITE